MLRVGMPSSSILKSQHVAIGTQQGGQTCATCCVQQGCDMLHSNVAIVWPEIANTGSTMLRYVASRCCYRLAGAISYARLNKEFKEFCLFFNLNENHFWGVQIAGKNVS